MIAFLEQVLLDEAGNVRPQYKNDIERQGSGNISHSGSNTISEVASSVHQTNQDVTTPSREQPPASTFTRESEITTNTRKRKHDELEPERWLFATEEVDLAQHLPSQSLLLKVVDFFTTSFHHWIPYLHKQRLQAKVREGICSNGLLLVLHALVAVTLRHMDPNILFLDNDQIQRQSRTSRVIVETYAIRSISVESLQALIFVVFDYVSTPGSIH